MYRAALNRDQQPKLHEWFIIGEEETSIPGNGDMTNSTPNCNCADCIENSRISGQHKNSDISSFTLFQTSPESNPILCCILVKKSKTFRSHFCASAAECLCEKVSTFFPPSIFPFLSVSSAS
ncbi:hypothetical protein CDAR_549541 [Caerostris darwini]|uniref:Uncharacterized protein n=1 Tax=Caerostris darwini TaxID=1538125 RepID=A0AAV4V8H4_9ARAC|nr:hypothetical protein CDAR_549541 [Caerostris darwini]